MNRLENEINNKLQNFKVEPPADMWQAIEGKLNNNKPSRVFAWWRLAAAAAVLAFLSVSSLVIFNRISTNRSVTENSSKNSATTPQIPESTKNAPVESLGAENSASVIPLKSAEGELNLNSANELVSTANELVSTATAQSQQPSLQLIEAVNDKPELLTQQDFTQQLALNIQDKLTEIQSRSVYLDQPGPENLFSISTNESAGSANRNPYSSISLAAYFAPQNSFRYHQPTSGTPDFTESQILSYSTGINISYRLSRRWQIQSGFGYNRLGQRVNDIASFSHPSLTHLYSADGLKVANHPQSLSTSMGGIIFTDQSLYFADIASTRIITMKGSYDESVVNMLNKTSNGLIQYFEYIELPINARYLIYNRLFSIYGKMGITANYLYASNVYLAGMQHSSVGHSVGVSRFNIAGNAGFSFSYPLTHQINMNIEPTASMFLRPVGPIKSLNSNTYPYTWSIQMGLSYSL